VAWKGYFQSAGWLDENQEPTGNMTVWYTEEVDVPRVGDEEAIFRIATIVRSTPRLIRVKGEMEVVYQLGDVFFVIGDHIQDDDSMVSLVYKPDVYFCYRSEDDERLAMRPKEIDFHKSITQEALSLHPFGHILEGIYQGQEKSNVYYLHLLHRN
jgi:hypothetical protein